MFRDALVALALEVVLGEPEDVVARAVHQLRDLGRLVERRHQPLVHSQRSLTGVASRPWSSKSTPAYRLPKVVIMVQRLSAPGSPAATRGDAPPRWRAQLTSQGWCRLFMHLAYPPTCTQVSVASLSWFADLVSPVGEGDGVENSRPILSPWAKGGPRLAGSRKRGGEKKRRGGSCASGRQGSSRARRQRPHHAGKSANLRRQVTYLAPSCFLCLPVLLSASSVGTAASARGGRGHVVACACPPVGATWVSLADSAFRL